MASTKLDPKNVGLVKLVYRLRQDIDLYRIIGLNVEGLKRCGISPSFWAHVQLLAHESVALSICKIFEHEKRNDLNSIPGIIDLVPACTTPEQKQEIDRFARRFGVVSPWTDARLHLRSVFEAFSSLHEAELQTLKVFRDKFGAHSERGALLKALPSVNEFEAMFEFADAFYRLVSDAIIDVSPALVGAPVGVGALSIMEHLGVASPRLDFESRDA